MISTRNPSASAPDFSAGECCARAQAESWARAEARRFAPTPAGLLTRLRAWLARRAGRMLVDSSGR